MRTTNSRIAERTPDILVSTAVALAACGERQVAELPAEDDVPSTAFVFLQQKPTPDHAELQALGGGKLVLKDRCLRLENGANSRVVLWPPGAVQTGEGVFDPGTGTTVRLGEFIVMGGGEIDGVDPNGISEPIPETCTGPYWLGASGFFRAPPEEWTTVRIAEKFSINVRQSMKPPTPPSLPVVLADDGLTLSLSEGPDVCDGPLADPQSKHWVFNVYSDQRLARVVRQKTGPDAEAMEAVFRGVDGPRGVTPPVGEVCLRVAAECENSQACDDARAMLSTIRFGDLGAPD